MAIRGVEEVLQSKPTIEGAGVHLRRAFGYWHVPRLDPFLMLDDFRGDNPAEYAAGFPWHPHRGIETVTYMMSGRVNHEDSMGNKGIIGPGDVQWMTAGSGIIHQEMPKPALDGRMGGFQLWVNLPSRTKMMQPRYQEVQSTQIPEVDIAKGVRARVIAGQVAGQRGPVRDLMVEPQYLDVTLQPGSRFTHGVTRGHRSFAYLVEGAGVFDASAPELIDHHNLVIFGDGDDVEVQAGPHGLRLLLVAGKPLGEPVAWWGPIVMNNKKELEVAIEEYHNGTFIKSPNASRPVRDALA